ncbi:hypothetical protein Tco_0861481 [Tanacetum coccineum]|uniref:Uncharacterized protein n=1 Tax=Tanacetum coccineum TaxID=301880 RepID=A0ABQ5BNJ6_9ASTR
MSYSGLEEFQQPEFEGYGPKPSKSVSEDTSNEVKESPDVPLVEELVSDDKLEKKTIFPTVAKMEFVRPKQQEKPVRKPVKYAEMYRNMAPRAVLMKSGLKSLNTARPVNNAHPKTTVYSARPMSHFSKSAQSTIKRPYQTRTTLTNKNFSQKVNTAKGKFYTARPKAVNTARPNSAVVNVVRENQVNVVKASACWVWRPTKLNSASITLKKHNYVDARGISKCKPKPFYDETSKMAIGYKNPLYLKKVTQVQPTLYDGYAMVKTEHTLVLVSNSEETLNLAEKSRQKMLEKVKEGNQSELKAKLNFGPPDYLKASYPETFIPQNQLTPEQLYWSKDLADIAKEKALEQSSEKPKTALMVYPPNTLTKLRTTPKGLIEGEKGFEQTKECYLTEIISFFNTIKQYFEEIHINLTKEIKEMKDVFEQMEKEVEQNDVDKRCAEIERKNLLIENENLIATCISTDVLSCVMADVHTISQISKLNNAFVVEQASVVQLKAEISKLKHKIEKDDHNEMIKSFSIL